MERIVSDGVLAAALVVGERRGVSLPCAADATGGADSDRFSEGPVEEPRTGEMSPGEVTAPFSEPSDGSHLGATTGPTEIAPSDAPAASQPAKPAQAAAPAAKDAPAQTFG